MPGLSGTLTNEQLAEVMGLIKGADSVELKLTVPDHSQRSAMVALDIDPLEAQLRQVVFFDTPDLDLDKAGVVVRARRSQGADDDTVVKLRPVDPSDLPDDLRMSSSFGVEVDAMPGGFVCSGSMKGKVPAGQVREVLQGKRELRKLFNKDQRALFEQHAPEGIKLEDLSILGPIFVLKLKFVPEGAPGRLVGEAWLYPDGSRIIELSTKCLPNQAFQVSAELRVFLMQHGIDPGGEQQTKTRTALEFFASELKAAQA